MCQLKAKKSVACAAEAHNQQQAGDHGLEVLTISSPTESHYSSAAG